MKQARIITGTPLKMEAITFEVLLDNFYEKWPHHTSMYQYENPKLRDYDELKKDPEWLKAVQDLIFVLIGARVPITSAQDTSDPNGTSIGFELTTELEDAYFNCPGTLRYIAEYAQEHLHEYPHAVIPADGRAFADFTIAHMVWGHIGIFDDVVFGGGINAVEGASDQFEIAREPYEKRYDTDPGFNSWGIQVGFMIMVGA